MKLVTFAHQGESRIGVVEGDALLDLAAAWGAIGCGRPPSDMLSVIAAGDAGLDQIRRIVAAAESRIDDRSLWRPLPQVRLQAPIPRPRKNVFCVARNYKRHIEEGARARGREPSFPVAPEFFSKPPATVVGQDEDVELHERTTKQLDYEVELAIVIGKTLRDASPSGAADAVFGYTVVNDITGRELGPRHGQLFKGKSLDTSCPMGPWIVTKDEFEDPSGHRITLRVNGETRQDSSTSDMLFDCIAIICSLSAGLTLEPGDVIATGTPSGVALGMSPQKWLKDGDLIEAEIEGIGVLRNRVRAGGRLSIG